jgi:segregation and condensation protein A
MNDNSALKKSIYTVKAGSFEGPLDLLLSLIENRKLFVNEISLADVTNDYILYIKSLSEQKFSDTTSFIIVASTLILIKSRSLLPNMALTEKEEVDIHNLENRLELYKIIREAGDELKTIYGAKIIFPPREVDRKSVMFAPDNRISTGLMERLIVGVIDALPKKEFLPQVEVKKVISIEEMIDSLTERLQEGIKSSFHAFSGKTNGIKTKEEKVHVIVSFLAMLELVRQGIIDVLQNENYGDIEFEKREVTDDTIPEIENNLENKDE